MPQHTPEKNNIITYFGGEAIFKEGQTGNRAYIIKNGKVEISVERDGKRVVLDTLHEGKCFGEMALIIDEPRTATATAVEFSELFILEKSRLDSIINVNPLVRALVYSLTNRLKSMNDKASTNARITHPVITFAEIIKMKADIARSGNGVNAGAGHAQSEEIVVLDFEETAQTVRAILGYSPYTTRQMFKEMSKLGLIKVEIGRSSGRIMVKPDQIQEQAMNVTKSVGHVVGQSLQAEFEYIEPSVVSEIVEVDRNRIMQKLAQDDFADDIFMFRKSEIMRILNEHGKKYFEKRKRKSVEDFDEIADIELVDSDTLFKVFGGMDPYKLAMLTKTVEPHHQEIITNSMSNRRKEILLDTMSGLGHVNDNDAYEVAEWVIDEIKRIKLGTDQSA